MRVGSVLGGAGHGRGSRRDGIIGESACGDGGVGQIAAAMGCRSRRPGTWGWNLGIGIMGRRREGTCCRCRPRRWACGSRAFPASSLARRHPCFRPAGFRSSRAYPAPSCRGPRAFWKPVSETFLRRRSRLDLRAARVLCVERGTRDEESRCLRARCAVRSRKRSGRGCVSLRRARAPCSDEGSDCEDVRRRILVPSSEPRSYTTQITLGFCQPYLPIWFRILA